MIIPDANVLIYAYDSTARLHNQARGWWEAVLSGNEPVGIPWIVVLAFTRLMTHPQICENPISTEQVREIIMEWTRLDHVRLLNPAEDSVGTYFNLLADAGIGGNLSTDALIALIAREHSATIYSNDRDFGRFKGLKVINPLV
jgi:toxin-antitoxin system PIN domain toxin